jgi:hypothetical protein
MKRRTDKEIIKLCHDVQIGTGGMDYADALTAIAEELEERGDGWIPVTQELPPNRNPVLAFAVGLYEPNGIRMSSYDKDQPASLYWHGFIMGMDCGVSHWMPMPKYPAMPESKSVAPPLPYQGKEAK